MHGSHQDEKRANPQDVCWRVTTATGVRFACGVHIIGARIEVRLTTEQDNLVCARVVPSFDAAGAVARGWLHTVVANDGIGDVDSGSHVDVVH